jgi:hypothetical protein
MMVEDNLSMGK